MLKKDNPKMKWFEDARLGMFIHWGLYSATEGFYGDRETKGIVEWIQSREEIPIKEYEKYASNLSTEKFNAAEIADLAKEAGAKYVTFTSKHHEGFAMFDTKYDDYSIMARCKADVDPVAELCREVRKRGMHPCLYYSHSIDFHEENAFGNDWDFEIPSEERDIRPYLNSKTKTQLKEILTNYGDIDMIWFDVPRGMNAELAWDIRNFVLDINPDCVINGRLVYSDPDSQDFICMGDNETPQARAEYCSETCATTNDSWGYKRLDKNFKSNDIIIKLLCSLVSKGVNLLLNIGPKPDGSLPEEAVAIFKYLGRWMKINSDAVYGTAASPFMADFSFGWVAQKGNTVYLYVKKPQGKVKIYDFPGEVLSAETMEGKKVSFAKCGKDLEIDLSDIVIDKSVTVIKMELGAKPENKNHLYQQEENYIFLPGCYCKTDAKGVAEEVADADSNAVDNKIGESVKVETSIVITNNGVRGWKSTNDFVYWDFEVINPGEYDVVLYTSTTKYQPWKGEHKVLAECAGEKISATLKEDVIPDGVNRKYFSETGSVLGKIRFDKPGKYTLKLFAEEINAEDGAGLGMTRAILKKSEMKDFGF